MRVLAVDTTTLRGSAAVAEWDELLGELRLNSETAHSSRLVPAVQFLLDGLGLRPADLGGYAVATGPGSFTGLRVGLSTIQGLALASGRPCLGVSALDILAARIQGAAPHLAAMMDAFRGEVYAALYDGLGRLLGERRAIAPGAFLTEVPAGSAFLGDGVVRYRSEILRTLPDAILPVRSLYLAGTLARLAGPRLAAGQGAGPETLRPIYLRGPDIHKDGR